MTCFFNLRSGSDFKYKAVKSFSYPLTSLTYLIHLKLPRSVVLSAKATILATIYGRVGRIIQTWGLMLPWVPTRQSWHWASLSLSFSCLLWKWGQEDLPGRLVKVFGELSRASYIDGHRQLGSVPGAVGGGQPREIINRPLVQDGKTEKIGLVLFFSHYPHWLPAPVRRRG